MRLRDQDILIKRTLGSLFNYQSNPKNNLTCIIERISDVFIPSDDDLTENKNLFSMIFLSTCVILTCTISIAWFAVIHYRRCRQRRLKKQEQKELENTVQKILEKTPIIIFNPKIKEQEFDDDDPVCAVCLESFHTNEKLRKLSKI